MSRTRKFNKEKTSSRDVIYENDWNYITKDRYCRARCWITLVYPESCALDWIEYLQKCNIPCFISPIHNKDMDENGNMKKSHYHVLFYFEGKVSFKYIKKIIDRIKGTGCFIGHNKKQYSRYLCHLDNPEKFKYETNDVIAIGGLDYFSTIRNSLSKNEIIGEIMTYCDQNHVYNFAQLMRYAKNNRKDWFDIMISSTYVIKEYLQSAQNITLLKNERKWGIQGVISNS